MPLLGSRGGRGELELGGLGQLDVVIRFHFSASSSSRLLQELRCGPFGTSSRA